jgi:FkbM family methyltransferase
MNILDFIKKEFNEDSIIFEIGCHMGLDTVKIKQITNTNSYHCFECDPRNVEILKRENIDIILNEIAVYNIDGETDFYQSTGNPGVIFDESILNENDWTASSSIKKPKKHLEITTWCGFTEPIRVKSIRIDTYCKQNSVDKIDFVWMDVQGAEREVFEGFGEMLENTKYIYTEYSDQELYEGGIMSKSDIIKVLGENWQILHNFGNDLLIENKKI